VIVLVVSDVGYSWTEEQRARQVAEWLLAEARWEGDRAWENLSDAYTQGRRDGEQKAYERGRADEADAHREIDADRARTVSTPKTRHWALGHALKWCALSETAISTTWKAVAIARDFDDFITGGDQ
jgi:hypothetical protein